MRHWSGLCCMITGMAEQKKDNFIKQAGILAAAGIIVRIIGLLYRSPLTAIIGDEGNGYYGFAYNIYVIILLIASYSIPSAISKVMAQKMALGEYRNAQRLFHCAILYVVIVGGVAGIFAFAAAQILVVDNAVPVLRIFAPTIFFSGLLGVLRGYYQAHRTMVPTSLSQILEQILNAAVSIGAAYLFIRLAITVPGSVQDEGTKLAIRGAEGSAVGTGVGVITGLIFMLCIYLKDHRKRTEELAQDNGAAVESYGSLFKVLLTIVTPFILSTFIYNFSTSLNQTVYSKVMMSIRAMSQEEAATLYGIFSGKAVVIANIPIAFSSAMASAVIPGISAAFAKNDRKETVAKVDLAVRVTMLISIPAAIGLFALARPVMQLLFPQPASLEMASYILRMLAVTVIFYSLSTLTNAILQSIGKVNAPVWHAAIALVIQLLILLGGLYLCENSLLALVAAQITYSLCMCILNAIAVHRNIGYREDILQIFVKPLIASAVMGLAAFGAYRGMYALVSSNVLALFVAIVVAVVIYFVLMIRIGAVSERELKAFPKGSLLVRVAKKCHLL